jgi:hypothetical protein
MTIGPWTLQTTIRNGLHVCKPISQAVVVGRRKVAHCRGLFRPCWIGPSASGYSFRTGECIPCYLGWRIPSFRNRNPQEDVTGWQAAF